ncbi:hypothetical protein [Luteolibacter marinus]|uniref:hypothetical protein n=1 Tax=Luteolibacter marinus TaxID=2776705 RepID=UPI001868B38D|nr:hypothetical protein [Luteolibacter marinus]
MDDNFQTLEDTLKGMRPVAPDAACLDRLLAAVEGRLQVPGVSTAGVVSKLSAMQPAGLTDAMTERMVATVSKVAFPIDEKVVLFPGGSRAESKPGHRRPWFAAAAAVAMAGAFSALMMDGPGTVPPAKPVAEISARGPAAAPRDPGAFVNASFGSGLEEAKDEGVKWTADGRPVRRVRVIYRDRVQLRDANGRTFEAEVPRVEYLEVPEKID